MPTPSQERIFVTLLREIAAEQGYTLTPFSQDWILRFEKAGQARHTFGFNFEINSTTAYMLAGDKAAVAAVLQHQAVPHIEHRFFINPNRSTYVPETGHWPAILAYAQEQNYNLVAKPNEGTGGLGVVRVTNQAQLEKAVLSIFQKGQSLSLSPYYDIHNEYRLIMLDGECQLAYAKQRPQVSGDGTTSLRTLIERQLLSNAITQAQAAEALEQHRDRLDEALPSGQTLTISWKHNLGAGSAPQLLDTNPLLEQLLPLAIAAQQAINIRFASIDIVEIEGSLRVLEVNSGIMMEHFVQHQPQHRDTAKAIYARALEKMFASR